MIFLGEISYPLYLTHVLVYENTDGLGLHSGEIVLLIALVFSILLHYAVELPVRMIRAQRRQPTQLARSLPDTDNSNSFASTSERNHKAWNSAK